MSDRYGSEPKETREEWGVRFADGSVMRCFNGKTARQRAEAEAASLSEKYHPDRIVPVRRVLTVGPWQEPSDG